MSDNARKLKEICAAYDNDRTRMMDIVRDVQSEFGHIPGNAMDVIADCVKGHRVEVEGVVSFYSFLSDAPKGKVVIRMCNDVMDSLKGCAEVADAFRKSLGIDFGETTPDGKISLEHTACMGMCDQSPAALVNDTMVTNLDAEKATEIAEHLKTSDDLSGLVNEMGDGKNSHELVRSMVKNNIREKGEVIFADYESGTGLKKALAMTPQEVIRDVKTSRLRGRGGAGFPTGMKWEFTRKAEGKKRYVICNADEGEPGTFKDRVVLTECPELLFEGMTIAGYAIGSSVGILYIRGEYAYLRPYLENILKQRRDDGLLGKDAAGKKGFDFDIRIQMGAGAYVCGEETALISSCEGLRGDPKTRPPFPAQEGYLSSPTTVNNVETFCCVSRILDKGPGWFAEMGTDGSPGTKLLSVSGDCKKPGIYEIPFGVSLNELLEKTGAEKTKAVQVGGAAGQMVGPDQFNRVICYDDLATGGSIMIFNEDRNPLQIASKFMEFFIDESCGYCTPCRVGNVLLKERLDKIINGRGVEADVSYLQELGKTVKTTSRCGLGQT
ncbi:MAG: NAD(P)H-dependent oxidoreductase subunit E, partial [Verrucomicrobiota bacterium]